MCDEHSIEDMLKSDQTTNEFSRRRFAALSLGAGFISMLPTAANAAEVKESNVQIKTPDGVCDAYFVHPTKGKHPAVLIWPDIFGLRTSFRNMGKRLAESGYSVLVVNPFYRGAKAPVVPEGANFQDPDTRTKLFGFAGALNADTHVTDAKAFIAFLDSQSAVDTKRKMATTGYCMGGPITMRAAAALPERVGAAASFHGGGLVTDKPDSPHLLVTKMKAQYLFAIADNDDQRSPKDKEVLRETFDNAKLFAEIEVYKGAMHGWCPPDGAAYNHEQAEKAWSRMLELFKKALV
jgi:carboxymethylenebutenolidase